MATFDSTRSLRPAQIRQAITAEVQGTTTLATTLIDILAWIQNPAGLNRTFACPRCGQQGEYQLKNDTKNNNDTNYIPCVTCSGWGYTIVQVQGPTSIVWPVNQ